MMGRETFPSRPNAEKAPADASDEDPHTVTSELCLGLFMAEALLIELIEHSDQTRLLNAGLSAAGVWLWQSAGQ